MHPLIFVSYHKRAPILPVNWIIPIHVGRKVAHESSKDSSYLSEADKNWLLTETTGDDTGDNISSKNREYCEMTGIYWIWKNIDKFENVTHIGHMQYRRHFYFDAQAFWNHSLDLEKLAYGCIHLKNKIDQTYLTQMGLEENRLTSILREYRGILPVAGDFSPLGISNLWEDFLERIPGVHVDDLIRLREILLAHYPEFAEKFDNYLDGNKKLMYQMFVLQRADFIKYCEFVFPILFKLEGQLNVEKYSINGKRTLGYLAEFLYGCYFYDLLKDKNFFTTGVSFLENV